MGVGRFGPYVKHGKTYASIPKAIEPLDLSYDDAVEILLAKTEAEAKSLLRTFSEEENLEIRDGRFGPYIKYQGDNYKLPKGADVSALSYEEVKEIIASTPVKKAKGSRSTTTKAKTTKATPSRSRSKKATEA